MLEAKDERELVRVPVRRTPLKEEKAEQIGNPLPIDTGDIWEIPRRWKVY